MNGQVVILSPRNCASGDEQGNETDEDGDEVEMVSLIDEKFDDRDDGDDD